MTIVEKAAYLKGLSAGLGVDESSREGKLWNALCDLVSDMAHEIEDLQATSLDYADALDEISEDLTYLEELTCDLDVPSDMDDWAWDDEDDGFVCTGDCSSCGEGCGNFSGSDDDNFIVSDESVVDDEEDEELQYDGVLYDVTCPKCGEEITFDEETLAAGSTKCPKCGEILEFDLDSEE